MFEDLGQGALLLTGWQKGSRWSLDSARRAFSWNDLRGHDSCKWQSQLNPCVGRWPGHDLCQNTIPTIFVEWCTWAIWFQLNPISGRLPPFSQENVFASLVSMQHLAFVSIIGANYRREKMTVWQELSELFQLFELFSLEVFFSWELISETLRLLTSERKSLCSHLSISKRN